MADFKSFLENPETLEEKRARWFNKLRGWVPQCIWFENLQGQDLTELVLDTIEQPDFGGTRDLASTTPINIFHLTSTTAETIGSGDVKDLLGNTFTPASTFEASAVGFDIRNINSVFGHINIEVYATVAGLPTGGPLASTADIEVSTLDLAHGTLNMYPLVVPITLLGSVQYAVVVNQMTADGDVSIARQSGGPPALITSTSFASASSEYTEVVPDPNLGSLITTNLTVSTWIKTTSAPTGNSFMGHWNFFGSQMKWAIYSDFSTGTIPNIYLSQSGSSVRKQFRYTGNPIFGDGQWHHIVFVYDASEPVNDQIKTYIDGVFATPVRTINNNTTSLHNSTEQFRMGRLSNSTNGNGQIDEVSVWKSSFSAAEALEIYNGGMTMDLTMHSQVANGVSWWKMGDGDTHPTITDHFGVNDLNMINMSPSNFVTDAPPGPPPALPDFVGGTYVVSDDDGSSWALDATKDNVFQVSGFGAGATLDGRTAQQILADNRGQLQSVALALYTETVPTVGTIRVEIVDDNAGSPGSVVHGYADIDVTTLPIGATGFFVGYPLTPVQNLAGNLNYWIVVKNTVLPDAIVFTETKLGGGFPQEHKVSFDSGNIWSEDIPAIDIAFQVVTERTADAEVSGINVAAFQSIAVVMAQVECALVDHIRETYICQAAGAYLDEHGLERSVARSLNELDISFRERIKNITNSTACPTIKQLVDALLAVGEATIIEDYAAGLFFDRENFFNRGEILIDPIYNAFTIIVDKQVHPPYSFYNREYFFDRDDFIGQQDSRIELFEIIVEAVNSAKALGTVYRLVERLGN